MQMFPTTMFVTIHRKYSGSKSRCSAVKRSCIDVALLTDQGS